MRELRIAPNLTLPQEAVTETFGILAKKGVGKTYTANVMAEEMIEAGHQVCIVDPIGVWFGLRSSADGKKPGLPVIILGGDHADAPLEVSSGAVIADFVVDETASVVIDLSRFRKGEQTRFMTDFGERLYYRNRDPLHLVLDEADAFAPQKPYKGQERMLGAIEDIVRRGRARGLGVTLISQRSAVLNKDVLTQIEVLIALRMTSPQDRKALDEWVKLHAGDDSQRDEFLSSLPSLPVGEAWFWSPGWLDIFKRVKVRQRKTFDSSATPKLGERRVDPKSFAEVDLEALAGRIAETIERAKADDPKELRRRIAELEKQLKGHKCPEASVERVEVPVLDDLDRDLLTRTAGDLTQIADKIWDASDRLLKTSVAGTPLATGGIVKKPGLVLVDAHEPEVRKLPTPSKVAPVDDGEIKIGKGHRTILDILAQWPEGRTHNELAFLSGYSAGSSTISALLSALRKAGLVTNGQPVKLTEEGLKAAGGAQARPTGPELLDYWRSHPRMGKGENAVLDVLMGSYPNEVDHTELCERSGYSPTASSVSAILSRLRKLGLVEKGSRRVSREFMESIR